MAKGIKNSLINPVLSFLEAPVPDSVSGGGKSSKGIVWHRFDTQKEKIINDLKSIADDKYIISYSGKIHLIAKMFDDSLAPSWTPNDLFETDNLTRIVVPAFDGFLIEISKSKVEDLIYKVSNAKNDKIKVDISRLESIKIFDKKQVLRDKQEEAVFNTVDIDNKQFNIWILPFYDKKARLEIKEKLKELLDKKTLTFGDSKFDNIFKGDRVENKDNSIYFNKKLDEYLATGILAFTSVIDNYDKFNELIASGVVYRIEPVYPLSAKSVPPGSGEEPKPMSSKLDKIPTVLVIDGGCSANSYLPYNVLNIPPLVDSYNADLKHGNKVISLICQGAAWNNNLKLPKIECKFISVQAINKQGVKLQPTPEQFVTYLRDVANKTKGISSVWNLSFNESEPHLESNEISYLGHEINKIAREFNILPIISIGNKSKTNKSKLCPPADCESALTIAGRTSDSNGCVSTACGTSLRGPAPAGMRKPELSWFSTLRVIGGGIDTGTSYSAPLVSSIAAHTFKNLKDPSPDLVKALLINKSDIQAHDLRLGWGSPWIDGDSMPWVCKDGTVTLAWRSRVKAGFAYYWNDIPLPDEMFVSEGVIKGEIILTAILKPVVSELGGDNYFSTRLECALQHVTNDGKAKNMLGTMKESKEKEVQSRSELAKWSPIRHHAKKFISTSVDNDRLRLYARIYTRDLYQFNMSSHHELEEQEVAFVLTFKSIKQDPSIYNSMIRRLGAKVEVGVVDQNIDIDDINMSL